MFFNFSVSHVLLSLFLTLGVGFQYYYLLSVASILSPSMWVSLLPRYISSQPGFQGVCDYSWQDPYTEFNLTQSKIDSPSQCQMNLWNASVLFDALGLFPMTESERAQLFHALDLDNDGFLRWPELNFRHKWIGLAGVGVSDNGTVGLSDTLYNQTYSNLPVMWELYWRVEVWRRVRSLLGNQWDNHQSILHQFGNGLTDGKPQLQLF
jgi:hypothetical protein